MDGNIGYSRAMAPNIDVRPLISSIGRYASNLDPGSSMAIIENISIRPLLQLTFACCLVLLLSKVACLRYS